jgi:ankyrin repeat protein
MSMREPWRIAVVASSLLLCGAAEGQSIDRAGRSQLHYAVCEGTTAELRGLIANGADVNLADRKGWRPLHFAAQCQKPEAASLLIGAGAEVDASDSNGNTPLSTAVFNYSGDGRTVTLLLAAGADPDHENHVGVSPKGLAHTIANYDVAKFFP